MVNNPIRGNPSEFESLEKLFCTIRVRTENLESDLRSIANGTSSNFRGEAADTFRENLDKLAPLIREVPDIACDVERIFGAHKTRLIQLQRAANSAVARAETNWNEQRRADAAYDDVDRDVWIKRGQLLITPLWETDERTQLRCELDALEDHRATARDRLDRANDNANASEAELRDLADDEEQLNENTANELKRVDVGVLADPSLLEKLMNGFWEAVKYIAAISVGGVVGLLFVLPTEVLQEIYKWLDIIMVILTVVSIIIAVVLVVAYIVGVFVTGGALLAALPLVISTLSAGYALVSTALAAVSAAKFVVGVALYSRGELALSDLLWDALDVVLAFGARAAASRGLQYTRRALEGAGIGVTLGKEAAEARDGNEESVPDDWRVCTAPVTSNGGDPFDTYTIDLPDVDMVPSTLDIADIHVTPSADDTIVVSVPDIGTFDAMVVDFDLDSVDTSFEDIVDFAFELPEIDLDLSGLVPIDWHFDFEPPDIIFEDFWQAFDELRIALVPCELGTTL